MKRKLLLSALFVVSAFGFNAKAQGFKDVTSEAFLNPSFELSSEGVEYTSTVTKTLTSLYGWTIPTPQEQSIANATSTEIGFTNNGKGGVIPSDGNYFFWCRKGWGNANGTLSTTTNTLEAGVYYVEFDYKLADYSNNNNYSTLGSAMNVSVKHGDTELVATTLSKRGYAIVNDDSNPKTDKYMIDAPWTKMGAMFELTEDGTATIVVTQNLKNSGRSDVCYDNFKLYRVYFDETEGTIDLPIDITGYIANPSFEAGSGGADDYSYHGWTVAKKGGEIDARTSGTNVFGENLDGLRIFNAWDNSSTNDKSISQVIKGLPKGKYRLTAYIGGYKGSSMKLFAGINEVTVNMEEGTEGESNAQYAELEFTKADGDDINIGIKSTVFYKADNFRLYYLGEDMDGYIIAAKAELSSKIKEAESAIPTANIGDGVFQVPESAVATLNTAIVTAQSVYDDEKATLAQIADAVAALNAAMIIELNAPVADKKYKMINVTSADFNFTGNAVIYRYNASAEGKYDLSYDTKESVNYAQGFTFTPTAERNVYTLSFESENGETLYICTGAEYTAGRNDRIRVTTNSKSTNILTVEIIATSKEGVWNLKNIKGNALIGSNGKDDAGFYTSNARADFKLVEAEKATVSVSLAAGKYATRIFPFIPELTDVKAYTFGGIEEGNVITLNPVEKPTANVPYILENASSDEVDITLSGYGLAKQDVYTANGLTGSFAETTDVPAGSYVLQTQDNGQKFYLVGANTTFNMPNRAYLTVPAESAGVKAFSFGGETTGINGVETLTDGAVESIYTINGTRVNSLQKGLNIVKMSNGKTQKVLVK